jgi:DNA-binding NtrC family response regulator
MLRMRLERKKSMVAKPNILVVDDEPVVRESLRDWFVQEGYPIEIAASAREALQKLRESSWDILVTDIKMPGMDGLELQTRVDYVTKPLDPDNLVQIVTRAAERQQLLRENLQLKERIDAASGAADEIVGDSPEIQTVRERIQAAASGGAPVLIWGENGTGKALVARAIHGASTRRHMPLVTVSCGELPESVIEIELFGHEQDAFTDAPYQRKGRFELADGGALFCDGIGEISPKTQIDLLRVLQEKNLTRIGGSDPFRVDFRFIAAANRDLAQAVEEGDFRGDLYRLVSGLQIWLPPLRERRSDIPLLARYFLQKSARDVKGRGAGVSTEAMQLLLDYPWPGNVRELRNVIERAAVLQRDEEIQPRDLPLGPPDDLTPPSELSLADVEKRHIERVLAQVSGDVSKAAAALRIDETTLNRKLREYGLQTVQS